MRADWTDWRSRNPSPKVKPGSVAIVAFSMRPIDPNNLRLDDALLDAELIDAEGNRFSWQLWYHIPMHTFYLLDQDAHPMPDPLRISNKEEMSHAIMRLQALA